jgi:hypothetical protein
MKAKREQAYGDLLVIKLFTSNYARDLKMIKITQMIYPVIITITIKKIKIKANKKKR